MKQGKSLIYLDEVVEHLLKHKGPGPNGKAHPNRSIERDTLERAIKIAESRGLSKGFAPYHFKRVANLINDPRVQDLVIQKKGDSLLVDLYGGNILDFLVHITSRELRKPFTEKVGRRQIEVDTRPFLRDIGFFDIIMRYLRVKRLQRRFKNLKPYHLEGTCMRTYGSQAIIDEVLEKKIDQLLHKKYNGNLINLIQHITSYELREPLIDNIGGRNFTVKMGTVSSKYHDSPFRLISRYLEIKGLEKRFWGFRPYHLNCASQATYKDRRIVDSLLIGKVIELLETKYNNNLIDLIRNTSQREFFSPLTQWLDGTKISIDLKTFAKEFGWSQYRAIKRYCVATGQVELFFALKPYHLKYPAEDVYSDPKMVDEVLVKKFDQLLQRRYSDNLIELITNISTKELRSPFVDELGGEEVEVTMWQVLRKVGGIYGALRRYISAKGLEAEYAELRPYHLKITAPGSFEDKKILDELVVKKIDALLREKYTGNLTYLIQNTDQEELMSPFSENINGTDIKVSMYRPAALLAASPFQIVSRYIEAKGLQRKFWGIRRYHFRQIRDLKQDEGLVDEIVLKRIDQLLNEKYKGKMQDFIMGTRALELFSDFTEDLNDTPCRISVETVSEQFNRSPYEMLKRYHRLRNLDFPYTRLCFIGKADTRRRRIQGTFSTRDLKKIKDKNGRYDTSKFGLKQFNSDDKWAVREVMVEEALEVLLDREVHYLGLETEQFESIRFIFDNLNFSPEGSTIIERNKRTYNSMKAIQKRALREDRKMLKKINIEKGNFQDKVYQIEGKYNFVNLDFVGHVSGDKERAIQGLFEKDLLEDEAVIYVTIADSERHRGWANRAGYGRDQKEAINKIMNKHAGTEYEVKRLFELPYAGGTNGTRKPTCMFTVGYSVRRVA